MASDPAGYLKEHYNYELWMVRELHDRMLDPVAFNALDIVMRNACIEAFCLHSRALIDFYVTKSSGKGRATDITAEQYVPGFGVLMDAEATAFRINVNKQIAHLTEQREAANKISVIDFGPIRTMIEIQHRRFRARLGPELVQLIQTHDEKFFH